MRVIPLLLRDLDVLDEVNKLSDKLTLSEIINHAYIGSKYDKQKRNAKAFANWQSRILARIKKLLGQKTFTVWDSLPKGKSKKF